jgi:glyoxylase-like metal-dependent hydrolase (beta-lactamase superfamily II)
MPNAAHAGTTVPAVLNIEIFDPGPYQTNCMIVHPAGHSGCWIVDAGFEPRQMIARVRELGLNPEALILTHCHVDHIAGASDVKLTFPTLPIWVHEAESLWLTHPERNLSVFTGQPITGPEPDRLLRDGEKLTLGSTAWEVRHTPGHSPGSISLVCQAARVALVGDALFAGSIGRTDFPGCSFEQLESSIRKKLYTLPDDTTIYPGHGPTSTIGREKKNNPFVRP